MTEVTIILRNPPLKSDFDYRVLHLLWPKSLIYCVDFGLKPLNFAKATDEDKEKRVQLVYERVERVLKLAPFNSATEVSPLVTAYRYNTLAVESNIGDIVAHTVRLFTGIKTIYLDLGMELEKGKAQKFIEGFRAFNPKYKLGLIASASEYLKEGGDVSALLGYDNTLPCPFLSVLSLLLLILAVQPYT